MLRSLYRRAFVERIQALATRMDTLSREITSLRAEIEALRSEVQQISSNLDRVKSAQESLERHVETVIAAGWDTTAIARRLASVEDRLERG